MEQLRVVVYFMLLEVSSDGTDHHKFYQHIPKQLIPLEGPLVAQSPDDEVEVRERPTENLLELMNCLFRGTALFSAIS